jgi:hypothetical protein
VISEVFSKVNFKITYFQGLFHVSIVSSVKCQVTKFGFGRNSNFLILYSIPKNRSTVFLENDKLIFLNNFQFFDHFCGLFLGELLGIEIFLVQGPSLFEPYSFANKYRVYSKNFKFQGARCKSKRCPHALKYFKHFLLEPISNVFFYP